MRYKEDHTSLVTDNVVAHEKLIITITIAQTLEYSKSKLNFQEQD